MGFIEKSAFTTRSLQPQRGNKKNILDLFMYKKQCRDYLLNSFMTKKVWSDSAKAPLREKIASHAVYREEVNGYADQTLDQKKSLT